MRTEQILSADILDILFDNRNKSYGAYDLRKHYANRMTTAILVTFTLASTVIFTFIFFKKEKVLAPFVPDIIMHHFVDLPHDIKPAPILIPKQLPTKPAIKAPSQLFVKNIIIARDEAQVTKLATNLDNVAIAGQTVEGPGFPAHIGDSMPATSAGSVTPEPVKNVDKITPLNSADVMPSFPGGMDGLRKFLQRHLQNPEEMEQGNIVLVKIKFVVSFEGKLKSFEIVEDGGTIFNTEVIRVLKKMPGWIPGKSNGEAVSVYYTIPVKFTAAE